jgi:predicted glycoside hydrolase/deacetylase ChbG (UPF0249 family)
MQLILNADDLGASNPVNDEIFELMESGLLTSATIIANAPAFEAAVKQVQNFPNCSFGVHLNLTVFPPLSPSSRLEPILDENGHLSKKFLRQCFSPALTSAFLQELTFQVERTLDAGVPVSHFDSHQHIHTKPCMWPVLKRLQRRFRIRKVRSTINLLPPGQQMKPWRQLKKYLFDGFLRHIYSTKSPEGLGDFRDFYAALKQGNIPRFRSMELMIHPGTSSNRYKDEVALLRSGWKHLLPPDVTFGSYHSI